jgi:hypothetical protein
VSHIELFNLANLYFRGRYRRPIRMPALLARLGVWGRDLMGRLLGKRPFERPWMVRYIDADLAVDASRTYSRMGWRPRERLFVGRRIPFMVEHIKTDPLEWYRRNQAALKEVRMRDNLRIHRLLEKHHDEIRVRFLERQMLSFGAERRFPNYREVPPEILEWRFTVILRHLLNAVRTGEKGLFTAYCRDLAEKRLEDGFPAVEVCRALELLNSTCMEVLAEDPEARGLEEALHNHLHMTVQFGCDQVMETYEEVSGEPVPEDTPETVSSST